MHIPISNAYRDGGDLEKTLGLQMNSSIGLPIYEISAVENVHAVFG